MIRWLIQRITDFRREMLIADLRRDASQLYEQAVAAHADDKAQLFDAAREAWVRMFNECEQRSSAQIERMEDGEEYCA